MKLFVFCILFLNASILAVNLKNQNLRWITNLIRRKNDARRVENDFEDGKPGNALIQPTALSLKSSAKYPKQNGLKYAVYGNLDNLGVTFGKTFNRLRYTNFRKNDPLLVIVEIDPKLSKSLRNWDIVRKYFRNNRKNIFENDKPGHTLIQPTALSLKSSAKYPKKDQKSAVYGNMNNLGITHQKTFNRLRNTNLQKSYPSLVIIEIDPKRFNAENNWDAEILEKENGAEEILDEDDFLSTELYNTRRRTIKSKYRDRMRHERYISSSDSSADDESTDYERNPENPYTVFKGKYKQNWMWNHEMNGDHMNVNPFAPSFGTLGPSGASLFFGRKWWYFNQDDFKPLN